jgi:dTDP-4-dehydrorhamnose reductase
MKNRSPKESGKPEFPEGIEDVKPDNPGEMDGEATRNEEEYLESGGVKKVLVTGSKGQLGIKLLEILAPDFEVAGVDIEEMDITNSDDVLSCFYLHRPDIVIHTAAMTDVEGCEVTPEEAFRVNGIGTQNIVAAAREFDAVVLYLSTDYVFDGEKSTPYLEFDQTRPINVYGKSKLMGEMAVREVLNRFFVVRTSWLIGPGKNFVRTILNLAKERDELRVVDDQIGKPTFAHDLAIAIKGLINTPFYGTYHVTNAGETTWYKLAVKGIELAGLKTKVVPIMTQEYPTKARRPKNSSLANVAFEVRNLMTIPHWEDSLKVYLREEQFNFDDLKL